MNSMFRGRLVIFCVSLLFSISLVGSAARQELIQDEILYVSSTGSDYNDGVSANSDHAWLTIQHAVDSVAVLDFGGYNVTISVADGSYSSVNVPPMIGSGKSVLSIVGNINYPSNCLISATNANAFYIEGYSGYPVWIKGFKVQTSGAGVGICALNGAEVNLANLDFGSCASGHVASSYGANVEFWGDYSVSGSAPQHYTAFRGGLITAERRTITFCNSPAFTMFAYANDLGLMVLDNMTFVNKSTVSGKRFQVDTNAVINSYGSGPTYLPGSLSGTVSTGGQYN